MDRSSATIAELVPILIDHRGKTPRKLGGDFQDTGVPVISADNVSRGRLHLRDVRYVSEALYRHWMPEPLKYEDVLVTSEAPSGEVALFREAGPFCLGQRLFALRPDRDRLLPRYLYYFLRSPEGRHRIRERVTGTTAEGIRQAELRKVVIELLPIEHQVAITGALGALDDKIEVNLCTNETIQALGRAHFDQALLDDPVEVTIGDAFFMNPEQVGPGGLPDPLHYIDIGSVSRGTLNERITVAAAVAPSRARRLVRQGDTIISTVRPGRGAFLFIDQPDPRLVVSTGFAVLRPKRWPAGVSYFATTHPNFIQNLDLNATGAAYPAVPASVFEGLGVLMPAVPLVEGLERFLNPLLRLFHANLRQNEALAQLRDLLMPKLMAGEVRFKEAEKAEAEAL